jgi:signal transduction histidine kinase
MMKKRLPYILAAIILTCSSCNRFHQMEVHDTARADSLMEAAHLAHDNDRIIFLADSLASTGDFAPVKADYWRGYGHYGKWNHYLCRQYWYEGLELIITSKEEMIYHGRTANRLADVLLTAGDYEAAMRVALPAMEKMRKEGVSVSRDYGYLLVVVGCCELNSRNFKEADAYFNEAYKLFKLLAEDNGVDGGSSHLDNLKTAVAGLTSIARHNLEKNRFEEVLTWVDRLNYVMEDYRRQPETLQESLDRRETLGNFFRATALEGLGRHEEAAAAFDAAMDNPFASTPQGRVEGARYLMLAKRWDEAADSYKQLDGVANVYGVGLTLDNIQQYMLPKLRANLNARRNDQALATSIRLADALDSAIVRSKNDKAAELATVYHTQEIKEDFLQQKARLERERFVSSLGVIVLLIISFLVFVFLRYRSSIRLEEAYKQLEVANAHAQEASRVKTAFLQQISHEIRTPINLLSGFAQLLTTPGMELDEKSREEINEGVVKNTSRITGLISKILDLSDLISNPSLENKDSLTLGQIAAEAADGSGIRNNKDLHFDIMMADGVKDQTIVTNRKAVTRILGLLLENANKFTEKGMVSLRVVPKQSFVYFLVEDTGIGIPAEEAEHIFEHFVQLDDYQEGTGIGLSLARSLGRRLGGDVVLDTSYTFGARFIFSLPLNQE